MRPFKLKKCKRIHGLCFAPNGGRLLVLGGYEASGPDMAIRVDVATGEQEQVLSFNANAFAIADDRSRLAVAEDAYSRSALPRVVRWCDPWKEKPSWHLVDFGVTWSARSVSALAFSANSKNLKVAFGRQEMAPAETLWSFHLADCGLKASARPRTTDLDSQVFSIAAAPDGVRWATGNRLDRKSYRIDLLHLPGEKALAQWISKTTEFGRGSFSPDGRLLAVAQAREVAMLKGETLEQVGVLKGHKGQLNAVAFSPDSRRLLTASHDGAVRVWDTGNHQLVAAFDWKIGPVTAVAFAPDGLTAVAGGSNGRMVVWDTDE